MNDNPKKYPPIVLKAMAQMLLHDLGDFEISERIEWALMDVMDVMREHGVIKDELDMAKTQKLFDEIDMLKRLLCAQTDANIDLVKKLSRSEEILESCRELSWARAQELLELKRRMK